MYAEEQELLPNAYLLHLSIIMNKCEVQIYPEHDNEYVIPGTYI